MLGYEVIVAMMMATAPYGDLGPLPLLPPGATDAQVRAATARDRVALWRNRSALDRLAGAAGRRAVYVDPGQSPTVGPYR